MSLGIEVRDGRTEESERAEGDDLGACACWSGAGRPWCPQNDVNRRRRRTLWPNGPSPWRAVTPEDKFAGLADASLLAHDFPNLDLIDPNLPTVRRTLETHGARHRTSGTCRQGRQQIGRRVRIGQESAEWCWSPATAFSGAYVGSNHWSGGNRDRR